MITQYKKTILFALLFAISAFSVCFFALYPSKTRAQESTDCQIFSARYSPTGKQLDPQFYQESNRPLVSVNILTQNCGGKKIDVWVHESETYQGLFQNLGVAVPHNNSVKINYRVGEYGCSNSYIPRGHCVDRILIVTEDLMKLTEASNADCANLTASGGFIGTDCLSDLIQWAQNNHQGFYYSNSAGGLEYDCEGVCGSFIDSRTGSQWEFINAEPGEGGVENGVQIIPTSTGTAVTSNYQLLAPLPGIQSVDVGKENALADYLGLIFKLIIGITGVLSVLMIVLGGIEYMTSDVIFSKEQAKKRIWNAILGLLLALGSYAILNTLNPDLLRINLSIPDATVLAVEQDASLPPVAAHNTTGPCPYQMTTTHSILGLSWNSGSDANVQKNLDALKKAFDDLNAKTGGNLTASSAYRSPAYQSHLLEVATLNNDLKSDNNPSCGSLRTSIQTEINQHGLSGCGTSSGCVVAPVDKCAHAPHLRGIGIDINASNVSGGAAAADKIAADNNIPLRWQNKSNDPAHWNLQNPPYTGCAL